MCGVQCGSYCFLILVIMELSLSLGNLVWQVKSIDEAVSIMVPQTPEKMKEMLKVLSYKPVTNIPSCFLQDYIDVS